MVHMVQRQLTIGVLEALEMRKTFHISIASRTLGRGSPSGPELMLLPTINAVLACLACHVFQVQRGTNRGCAFSLGDEDIRC
jgi:hypothetical protein